MTQQKIIIGSDHAGFEYKAAVKDYLEARDILVEDVGCLSSDSVDYPDIAYALAEKLENNQGILICGSGVGISIAANRRTNIRCGLANDVKTASLARRHNDINVLAFGSRLVDLTTAIMIVETFLDTQFEGGRHIGRVEKLCKS
jgi:ribose 5-phosphate isomerase B